MWIFFWEFLPFYRPFLTFWLRFSLLQMFIASIQCFERKSIGSLRIGCSLFAVPAIVFLVPRYIQASLFGGYKGIFSWESFCYRVYLFGWEMSRPGLQHLYVAVSISGRQLFIGVQAGACTWSYRMLPWGHCSKSQNNYMGACCIQKPQKQHNYSSLISANSSFLLSDSSNDDKFLYLPELPLMDMLMRAVITKPKEYSQSTDTRLRYFLSRLKQQIRNLSNPLSDLYQKLAKIQLILKPQHGYLLFEIQRLEMNRDKNRKMRIEIRGESEGHSRGKSVRVKNYQAEVGMLVEWVVKGGKIQIMVEDSLSTIDLNEVENRLFVIEPVNIKNKSVLEPIGKMQVRIQYIMSVECYKESYERMLKLKAQHLQTVLKNIESGRNDKTDQKLIVSMMGMLDDSIKARTSFYENDFQI